MLFALITHIIMNTNSEKGVVVKLETVSTGAEDVSKVAGAVVAVAMAGVALTWVGTGIKSAITGIKRRKNVKKVEGQLEDEQTA